MPTPSLSSPHVHRIVFRFYMVGVVLLIVQVLLGGITRLTGSGLSITSWEVITGFFPPLSEKAWTAEFAKYQATPQYLILNTHFTLGDFKFIFFWEWIHRFWARCVALVGVAFLVYLWKKRMLSPPIVRELVGLFLFGALQGLIGWIMVKSGLEGDAIYVKPSKLAIHFIMAVGLISLMWIYAVRHLVFAASPSPKTLPTHHRSLTLWTYLVLLLTVVQLVWGCFMAGTKSAAVASTFPSINGMWLPSSFHSPSLSWWEDGMMIHFLHRNTAYLLVLLVGIWTVIAYKKRSVFSSWKWLKWMPLFLVFLQAILGVYSVLRSPYIQPNSWGKFEWLAEAHQLVAIGLVLCLCTVLYLLRPRATFSTS